MTISPIIHHKSPFCVKYIEFCVKYIEFSSPQNFYLWKKDKKTLRDIKDKDKELLIKVTAVGTFKVSL